jgi:hypothetical protein
MGACAARATMVAAAGLPLRTIAGLGLIAGLLGAGAARPPPSRSRRTRRRRARCRHGGRRPARPSGSACASSPRRMARLLAEPGRLRRAPRIEWTSGRARSGASSGRRASPGRPLVNFGTRARCCSRPRSRGARPRDDGAARPPRQAKWLVCNRDECIPGGATLSLQLPVGGDGAVAPATAAFRDAPAAARRLPRPGA